MITIVSHQGKLPTAEQVARFEDALDLIWGDFTRGFHGSVERKLDSLYQSVDALAGSQTRIRYVRKRNGKVLRRTVHESLLDDLLPKARYTEKSSGAFKQLREQTQKDGEPKQ